MNLPNYAELAVEALHYSELASSQKQADMCRLLAEAYRTLARFHAERAMTGAPESAPASETQPRSPATPALSLGD